MSNDARVKIEWGVGQTAGKAAGNTIPAVGFGSYLATEKNGKQTISDALDAGYRYIDTASFYRNEEEIGEAVEESGIKREELFICSKVWPGDLGSEIITKMAEKYGVSNAQLLLRYLLQREIPVIPKASSTERMKQNLDVFGFTVSEDDMSFLSCLPEQGWSGEHPDL